MFKPILIIGAGGFIGSVSRYAISKIVHQNIESGFPFGTFSVNILGCLIMGIIYGFAERGNVLSNEWRMFLLVGFCGGFTTFSAFANENLSMLRNMEFIYFFTYTGLSIFLGLLAIYFGAMLAKQF